MDGEGRGGTVVYGHAAELAAVGVADDGDVDERAVLESEVELGGPVVGEICDRSSAMPVLSLMVSRSYPA